MQDMNIAFWSALLTGLSTKNEGNRRKNKKPSKTNFIRRRKKSDKKI